MHICTPAEPCMLNCSIEFMM
uniref:Uncharacterized protein n=1 Tax=Anguilla anguilla TaxID=7936 RepID=A0A0E9XQZ1_ANGAN